MKKNVAGQKVGAQMTAIDGSEFTDAVTVYVTGDAGSQAVGSVGSGACVHEGHGYHTYAPSQAETNYDLQAFTFVGTGAITATVQERASFPQTVDNATNISAIKTKTDALPADPADASDVAAAFGTVNSTLGNIGSYVDTEVAAIKLKTDLIPANPAAVGDIPTAIQVADALLDRDMSLGTDSGSPTVRTPRQALRASRNKSTIVAGTLTVYKENDTTPSWAGAVGTTPGAEPVTSIDPA